MKRSTLFVIIWIILVAIMVWYGECKGQTGYYNAAERGYESIDDTHYKVWWKDYKGKMHTIERYITKWHSNSNPYPDKDTYLSNFKQS